MADNCISPPGDGGHDRPPNTQDDDPQQADGARSLMRRARARWYWLLPAVAVVANVYGFVGFPNPTESDVPEASADERTTRRRVCISGICWWETVPVPHSHPAPTTTMPPGLSAHRTADPMMGDLPPQPPVTTTNRRAGAHRTADP